ncbi:MAG: putative spermidine/putrescine transport system permease protein [Solirubrobacteraceae bacterium]|nr:putative spermidine/putrescine transport system permease protein [Solirubrobacteraceae bacterium]
MGGGARLSVTRSVSRVLYAHPRGRLGLLLGPAVVWLLVFYIASLAILLLTSFWQQDVFTAEIVRHWNTDSYDKLLTGQGGLWLRIFGRTVLLAAIVTLVDIAIAFPLAWFMARVLPARWRTLAFLAVVVPLWSSILVRIFAWRTILGGQGVLNTFLVDTGLLGHPSSAFLYNQTAIVITWANVWLPFMVLPIFTALEKIPDSTLEAARDLGANAWTTFRTVVLPLALPGVVAGSIFVFALTMGDFVAPQLVGGGSQVLGGAIKDRFGVAADYPFGAALASLTLVTLMGFLFISRRAGALENL